MQTLHSVARSQETPEGKWHEAVVTLDVDWAPDFVIDSVAEQLIARQVRATWFATHPSPAIRRLQQYSDLFELGIHPNFLSDSTQGQTPEAVLRYCGAVAPEATSMRSHALLQSTLLLDQVLAQTSITTDVSLFLPHTPGLRPVEYQGHGRTLLRIPFYWEDDFEMRRMFPRWHLKPLLAIGEGLKVFNFHPIHIYLNSPCLEPYEALKQHAGDLSEATQSEMNQHVYDGPGTRTLFSELLGHLSATGQSFCIRDIHEKWQLLRIGACTMRGLGCDL